MQHAPFSGYYTVSSPNFSIQSDHLARLGMESSTTENLIDSARSFTEVQVRKNGTLFFQKRIYPGEQIQEDLLFLSGSTYQIDMLVGGLNVSGEIGLQYTLGSQQVYQKNIVSGGNRIKRILSYDGNSETERKFEYSLPGSSNSSGVELGFDKIYFRTTRNKIFCSTYTWPTWTDCDGLTCSYRVGYSSSQRPLGNSSSQNIMYSYVKEIQEGNGYALHNFHVENDNLGEILFGEGVISSPLSNLGWKNGLKRSVVHYPEGSSIPVKEIKYDYVEDSRYSILQHGYVSKKWFERPCVSSAISESDLDAFDANRYQINAKWVTLKKETEKSFGTGLGDTVTMTTEYFYENSAHQFPTKKVVSNSDGLVVEKRLRYTSDYSLLSGLTSLEISVLDQMIQKNQIVLIEEEVISNGSNNQKIHYSYAEFGDGNYLPSVLKTSRMNSPFEDRITFENYDSKNKIIEQGKVGGGLSSYIWGYNGHLLVASVENSNSTNLSYTSFESSDKGGWTYNGTPITSYKMTGKKGYNLGTGAVSKSGTGASASNPFKVGFWARRTSGTGNVTVDGQAVALTTAWKWVEKTITSSSFSIAGSGVIVDELRLHPSDAMMTSYTYEPLIGMTSQTDPKGYTLLYQYDAAGRLETIKDEDGNIIEHYQYNYSN